MQSISYKTLDGIKHSGKWKHISSQYNIHAHDRNPRWDTNTELSILVLHDIGFTHSRILNSIGQPDTNANRLRVGRIVNRVKTSTTIPWITFRFGSDHQE